ncbi:EAL domain-containing protein [Pigmentiphaga litoralis]|uniref:sensor domain-containing phosphodiesterase n=1 Tax=Pigmentiphaga litoralis TaxID=516702 RepID=UPI003B43B692
MTLDSLASAGPPIPANEHARLAALRQYGVDSVIGDPGVDRIIQLASSIFHVPMALVSLVDVNRQLCAAAVGTLLEEVDRGASFCAYALGGTEIMMVPDASKDPRFANNPYVAGEAHLRFYAGCPLVAPDGHVIGTLCLFDTQPRPELDAEAQDNLRALAALVMDKLELRRLDVARQASQSRFEQMAAVSPDSIVCLDGLARVTYANPAAERLLGYTNDQMVGQAIGVVVPAEAVSNLMALAQDDTSLTMGRRLQLDIRAADGRVIPVEISSSMWREQGHASFCAVLRDITERRRNEARLYRLAHIDALTDLPNRILFRERVEAAFSAGNGGCLMMVDLDGFKDVNDSFGHAAGDTMLVTVAERLKRVLRPIDTAARMGGDEFAVVLPTLIQQGRAADIADQIIDALAQPVMLEGEPVTIGASIGIAIFPLHGCNVRDLLSSADLALYEAKAQGKHCRRFYRPALRAAALAKQAYQTEFPRALDQGEWTLHYQPIVRIADGGLVGAEAQLRWQHPRHGMLLPEVFMPALQSSPSAARIGHWMLQQACLQLAQWRKDLFPELRMSVNVLDAQFRTGDLSRHVRQCLSETGIPAHALELELTETILQRRDMQTVATLQDLRTLGAAIVFSNYGTGATSLDLLKRVPLSRLKIDPAFVQGMASSSADAAIVRVILYLGRSLELAVTAEGVDTEDQYARLRRKGCEEAQGAWVGEPLSAEAFAQRHQRTTA